MTASGAGTQGSMPRPGHRPRPGTLTTAPATADRRMPNADAAWLRMDRPTNLMVINALMLLDGHLDGGRLREVIASRLVAPYPRFRALVSESRLAPRGPSFRADPHFDVDRHLHHLGLPDPGDEQALRELVSDLVSTPLDRGKPLWDIYVLDRPQAGQALLVRMHHCIADGVALARVMLSLTDAAAAGDGLAAAGTSTPAPRGGLRGALGVATAIPRAAAGSAAATILGTGRVARGVAGEARELLGRPAHARELLDRAAADGRVLAKLLLTPPDVDTALRGELGVARSLAWTRPLDLAIVKAAAHAQGATVNDVLLAAVTGALRRHLRDAGEEPSEIRAFVPYNLRPLDEPIEPDLGNHFGLVFLTLPVDVAGRRARLQELKRRMDEIKHSPEGPISYAILELLGLTPPLLESRIIDIFTAKASAVMTNVPGPREGVYLAGAPVRAVLVWAPTSGSVGMSVSIFSYRGEVTIGLLVDAGLVPDPAAIMRHSEEELRALARLKPASAPVRPRD